MKRKAELEKRFRQEADGNAQADAKADSSDSDEEDELKITETQEAGALVKALTCALVVAGLVQQYRPTVKLLVVHLWKMLACEHHRV